MLSCHNVVTDRDWRACSSSFNTLVSRSIFCLYVPLFPNFSNARVPISSHSCFVTHLHTKYQHRITKPKKKRGKGGAGPGVWVHIRMILHDIGEDRTTQEDHMATPGRILDPNAELRESTWIAAEHTCQPQLF